MKSRSGSRVGVSGSFLDMISYHNFCPDRNTKFPRIPPDQSFGWNRRFLELRIAFRIKFSGWLRKDVLNFERNIFISKLNIPPMETNYLRLNLEAKYKGTERAMARSWLRRHTLMVFQTWSHFNSVFSWMRYFINTENRFRKFIYCSSSGLTDLWYNIWHRSALLTTLKLNTSLKNTTCRIRFFFIDSEQNDF